MIWSIRTRLTAWYLGVVVVVLVSGAMTAASVQRHRGIDRLDEDLERTMATLVAVMRNEFGEGMTVAGATSEASQEVVAPGRTLVVIAASGQPKAWGLPLSMPTTSVLASAPDRQTVATSAGAMRVFRRTVDDGPGRQFTALVVAPLREIEFQQTEMVRAMFIGVVCALLIAGAGGWLIGRKTLAPLATMARQAQHVDASDPRGRIVVPHADAEIGQLAAAFNGLLDRLTSSLDHQRQFMADASHELRTPVSVIRTTAQVTLSQGERSTAEYRESFAIVAEQTARLSRLVDDMFLLSRAEANGVFLRAEFVELDEIVAESVRALRVLAQQRGVTVTLGGSQEVGLTGDAALLHRLVTNLLDNAIRHAAVGGGVAADVHHVDGYTVLRITNDGPAIAPADRGRIFERFVRGGHSDGAGLGLPIARWIAAAHHGCVELESSEEHRTTFSVRLPIDPQSARPDTPPGAWR
jgi:heavy metal sensor kinase